MLLWVIIVAAAGFPAQSPRAGYVSNVRSNDTAYKAPLSLDVTPTWD